MYMDWIRRNSNLVLSPRVRLVDDGEADALRRKREQLKWRPRRGFLLDEAASRKEGPREHGTGRVS